MHSALCCMFSYGIHADVFGGDDLFSPPSKAPPSTSSKPAPAKKTVAATPLEDDLFASKPSGGKKTKTEDSLSTNLLKISFAVSGSSSKAKNSAGNDIFAPSMGGGEDS